MQRGKKNTVVSILVIVGICFGFADAFAQARKKSTRKTSSSASAISKASEARSSTTSVTTVVPVVVEPVMTAAEQAVYDQNLLNEEVSNLQFQLLNCLAPLCSGDIDYAGCFKTSNIPVKLAGDETCQNYISAASSQTVVTMATNNVTSTIKGYLKDACESAGGKLSGEQCKFEIYYYAKSPEPDADGNTATTQASRTYKLDDTVTCSYTAFGISPQQMEYKKAASTEQKMAMMTAGIEAGMSALTTTFAIVDAVQANKKLKESEQILGDVWYKFDGNSLTEECKSTGRKYGKKKDLQNDPTCVGAPDKDDGGYYCLISSNCTGKNTNNVCSNSNVEGKKDNLKENPCYVQITGATEIKRMEKQSELVKLATDFDKLKDAAANEALTNNLLQFAGASYMGSAVTSLGSSATSIGRKACSDGSPAIYRLNNKCPSDNAIDIYGLEQAQTCYSSLKDGASAKCQSYSEYGSTYFSCINASSSCTWDSMSKQWGTVQNATEIQSSLTGFKTNVGNISQGITAFQGSSEKTTAYNSAMTNYNTNQQALIDARAEKDNLQAQADASVQGAVSSGTQLILNSGTKIATTAMEISANKGIMTGACYLGNPSAGGSMILSDQQAKKITWTSF